MGNMNNAVYSLNIFNSDLIAAGSFTIASSLSAKYIASYSVKIIGINPVSNNIPEGYSLHQNYPNPFNPSTTIKFEIPEVSAVKIVIYDVLGKVAAVLVDEKLRAGVYRAVWNAPVFSSGVYFYSIQTEKFISTRKMVLIK
jgi:hypothetical protein